MGDETPLVPARASRGLSGLRLCSAPSGTRFPCLVAGGLSRLCPTAGRGVGCASSPRGPGSRWWPQSPQGRLAPACPRPRARGGAVRFPQLMPPLRQGTNTGASSGEDSWGPGWEESPPGRVSGPHRSPHPPVYGQVLLRAQGQQHRPAGTFQEPARASLPTHGGTGRPPLLPVRVGAAAQGAEEGKALRPAPRVQAALWPPEDMPSGHPGYGQRGWGPVAVCPMATHSGCSPRGPTCLS